jgi:hypothetical protein
MVKEAQPVCIHSSFSKRFEIASTRKLEQVISTGVHGRGDKAHIKNLSACAELLNLSLHANAQFVHMRLFEKREGTS